ncbi:MAG TPA: class I SAM-dependent methyltransferase [Pseudonocardia sp.]|nr:class I SAM-dependent methyltransferase [Pseudonocardia sp.]
MPLIPSPNIWRWPEVYHRENQAQDPAGAIWQALSEVGDWAGADVIDVGCGEGFHLPLFADTARSVVGVEPYAPLVARAKARTSGLDRVRVIEAGAERVPLPDHCADLVHARTAYFFGPGCEPGLVEADRLLRPGGLLAVVDLDGGHRPYGDWMRADIPHYDPADVERFFARQGFSLRRVRTEWRFPDRATLEEVLAIEFSAPVARRAINSVPGLSLTVGYRIHTRRRAEGVVTPRRQPDRL